MVGNCHPLLASAKDAAGRTQKNMTPRTSHKGEKQNHALEKCIAAANRGWMSEKYLPPAGQEKCFFLTSPFIEPVTRPVRFHQGVQAGQNAACGDFIFASGVRASVERALKA
jgi:hypothetical protein